MFINGNLIPSVTNTYTLGATGTVWKEIHVGPGTINISGPVGSNVIGTIGTDQNGIVYTESGFATPFINIGPSINGLQSGNIGGWVLGATGTLGGADYDLIAQQKLPGPRFPAGVTGPTYSLIRNPGPSLSYSAGNTGGIATLITTTVGTSATAVYRVGPITSTSTNIFLVMVNTAFTSQKDTVQVTVGRATSNSANATISTNIVGNVNPLVLPIVDNTFPANYIAAYAAQNDTDNKTINLSGHVLDTPGSGTFYYTVWMYSNASHNYSEMTVSLSVLKVQ
jgi:hypothetical protein